MRITLSTKPRRVRSLLTGPRGQTYAAVSNDTFAISREKLSGRPREEPAAMPDEMAAPDRREITLTVRGPDRRPLADQVDHRRPAAARLRLRQHRLRLRRSGRRPPGADETAAVFGGAERIGLDRARRRVARPCSTPPPLPFYWGQYEAGPRGSRTSAALTATAPLARRGAGVTVKGHPLLWHTVAAGLAARGWTWTRSSG